MRLTNLLTEADRSYYTPTGMRQYYVWPGGRTSSTKVEFGRKPDGSTAYPLEYCVELKLPARIETYTIGISRNIKRIVAKVTGLASTDKKFLPNNLFILRQYLNKLPDTAISAVTVGEHD